VARWCLVLSSVVSYDSHANTLHIWRCAGNVVDLTDASSWNKVKFWIEELVANEENCDIYIVGTKSMCGLMPTSESLLSDTLFGRGRGGGGLVDGAAL
jgi:hypothetical protein